MAESIDYGRDKIAMIVNLTVHEAQSVIEALATKATEAEAQARDFEYENNSLSNRTTDLESRVRKIEESIYKEGK